MAVDEVKFVEVYSIETATHFRPSEKIVTEDITIGGMYPLYLSEIDGQPMILDDIGLPTSCFMWNHGRFYRQIID
jgi:hypothetical protein